MRYALAILLASTVMAGAEPAKWKDMPEGWTIMGDSGRDMCSAQARYSKGGVDTAPTDYTLMLFKGRGSMLLAIGGVTAIDQKTKNIKTRMILGKTPFTMIGKELDGAAIFPHLTDEFVKALASEERLVLPDIDIYMDLSGSRAAFNEIGKCLEAMEEDGVGGNTL